MLKDKAKKEYQREYMKRKRSNIGSNISDGSNISVEGNITDGSNIELAYPDIIDKLTDPVWRGKLEKICSAFSRQSDMEACWLGDTNLSTVCGWLECTG